MDLLLQDKSSLTQLPQPRQCEGITIIGPDLFAEDNDGKLLSPIASAFPRFRAIVTLRGIHATHAAVLISYLRNKIAGRGRSKHNLELDDEVYRDMVPLVLRNSLVLIRSDSEDMEHIFDADKLIQVFVPRERIQFTGSDMDDIRRMLRKRGESWRMCTAPRSVREIEDYVRSCRMQVNTGMTIYYSARTGARFLTYEEFMRIRSLLKTDSAEAIARLNEIATLFAHRNSWGIRELSFFLPADKIVDCPVVERMASIIKLLEAGRVEETQVIFDSFADNFAERAGASLALDDEKNADWHTTMFCRLFNIDEHEMEEWALGLSPEFHLNVKWLPGGTVINGELIFDPVTNQRVKGMLSHYWSKTGGCLSINLGRVELSLTARDISGEERDVYLVVITTKGGRESIRLVRHMKYDVLHRLKLGVSIQQAVRDTFTYRNYIADRLLAAAELGFPILSYNEIKIEEDIPGLGKIPAFFFERQYIPGIVSDKIPLAYYRKPDFIVGLSRLLGIAAAFTLVLGRASPRTGNIFFDDGDELIQFNNSSIPWRLVIIETTGSFTNWTTPLISLLPQCIERFKTHLAKAASGGVHPAVLRESACEFADSLAGKISDVMDIASTLALRELFNDRAREQGGIRDRWEGILRRLDQTCTSAIRERILSGPELDFSSCGGGVLSR